MHPYAHLLSPIRVGDHILKNRLVYPNASPHNLQGPETFPAEGYRAFFSQIAKSGAGIVTIGEWTNAIQRQGDPNLDSTHMEYFDMSDPSVHNYISQLAEEIHYYGSKVILATELDMPKGYSLCGGPAFGPGFPPGTPDLLPLPVEQIPQVIADFVRKLELYKNLGFDGFTMRVDLHMVPDPKGRDDGYYGDIVARTRLVREAYAAVAQRWGGSFLREAIIAWQQPVGYSGECARGFFPDETMAFCKAMDPYVHIFQIREENAVRSHPSGYNWSGKDHPAADFAQTLKRSGIQALLEPVGGFQKPEIMERYLAEGGCDLIGMARGFIADYNYGEKLYAGQGDQIVPCLKCNRCHGVMYEEGCDPWLSVCSVNPIHGLGSRMYRLGTPAASPKKVAVIGGGPAGMRAAIFAAERGHTVTLFEKEMQLGGQMRYADFFRFKWPMKNYKNWMQAQLEQLHVDVRLGHKPTREEIAQGGFDAVLAATGAQAKLPTGIEGLTDAQQNLRPGIWTPFSVIGREHELGKRVVVVGGAESGVECAMYLADNGHDVTILTRQPAVCWNASIVHHIKMQYIIRRADGAGLQNMAGAWEIYDNIHTLVNVQTRAVLADGSVRYTDAEGHSHVLEANSVLVCGGSAPCIDEAMEYAGITNKFYPIGDCNGGGNIVSCTRDAFARVSLL